MSYTIFNFDHHVPLLKVFLQDAAMAHRILFGSDWSMTEQEELSVRAICFRLRAALGEDLFREIAESNPKVWLGEV